MINVFDRIKCFHLPIRCNCLLNEDRPTLTPDLSHSNNLKLNANVSMLIYQ